MHLFKKQQRYLHKKHGFTLVEVLIAITIFSLGLTVAWSVTSVSQNFALKAKIRSQTLFELENEAEILMYRPRNSLEDSIYTRSIHGKDVTIYRQVLDSTKVTGMSTSAVVMGSSFGISVPWEIHLKAYEGKYYSKDEVLDLQPLMQLSLMKAGETWY